MKIKFLALLITLAPIGCAYHPAPTTNDSTVRALETRSPPEFLYWADWQAGTVTALELSTNESTTLLRDTTLQPDTLAIADNRIWFVANGTNSIFNMAVDGSDKQLIIHDDVDMPRYVKVDSLHGRLFWTTEANGPGTGAVWTANIDGSNAEKIHQHNMFGAKGIVEDTQDGLLFVAAGPDILEMQLDSSFAHLDESFTKRIYQNQNFVQGLVLDEHSGRIYWASPPNGTISASDPPYSTAPVVVQTLSKDGLTPDQLPAGPVGVALSPDGENLYWTFQGNCNCVQTSASSGGTSETIVSTNADSRIFGVAVGR